MKRNSGRSGVVEDVLALAQPFVGIAVEAVDHLDRGDGVELRLGERVAGAGADEAVRQLRRQRHHLGDELLQLRLVEALLREGGEEDGVLARVRGTTGSR